MPRWIKPTAPEKGRKITFDDAGDDDESEGFVEDTFSDLEDDDAEMSTRVQSRAGPAPPSDDDEEESDDDDAPEIVGVSQGRESEASKAAKIAEAEELRKDATRTRAKKIQAIKDAEKAAKAELKAKNKPNAAGTRKGKGKQVEPEQEQEQESPFGEEDDDSFHSDNDEDDEGSFHSEGEEGDETDDSERLDEGPVDAETLRLRQRMQAAMEAAERNAMDSPPPASSSKTKKSALKKSKPAPVVFEEPRPAGDEIFDLQPGAPKPLSMDVLRKAAEAEEAAKGEASGKRKRRKEAKVVRKRVKGEAELERERAVGGRTTVHLLAPTQQNFNALPPVFDPRAPKIGAPSKALTQFEKNAMRQSGAAQRAGTRKKASLVMNR